MAPFPAHHLTSAGWGSQITSPVRGIKAPHHGHIFLRRHHPPPSRFANPNGMLAARGGEDASGRLPASAGAVSHRRGPQNDDRPRAQTHATAAGFATRSKVQTFRRRAQPTNPLNEVRHADSRLMKVEEIVRCLGAAVAGLSRLCMYSPAALTLGVNIEMPSRCRSFSDALARVPKRKPQRNGETTRQFTPSVLGPDVVDDPRDPLEPSLEQLPTVMLYLRK